MRSEVAEFAKLCNILAQHRRITVGRVLDTSFLTTWPTDVCSQAEFTSLISACYLVWHEKWKLDIGFLLTADQRDDAAHAFQQLIYELRTATQHDDNAAAKQSHTRWVTRACGGRTPETGNDWRTVGAALMTAINNGLRILCTTAARGRNARFQAEWRAKVAGDVDAIVAKVADDLGLQLSEGGLAYHAREVTKRWNKYQLRPRQQAIEVLDSFAEQSLVSRTQTLPCSYQDVLDELRVLGTSRAVGALHLAHAVYEITGARGGAYHKLLLAAWGLLQA